MDTNIKSFCERNDITEAQFYGKHKIQGDLAINDVEIPNGFCPVVAGSLIFHNALQIPRYFTATVGWSLHFDVLEKIPDGFNVTVHSELSIPKAIVMGKDVILDVMGVIDLPKITSFDATLKIKSEPISLHMDSVISIPEDFNVKVLNFISFDSLTIVPKNFTPTCGTLDINRVTHVGDGFKPTINGSMYIGALLSMPPNTSLTVLGDLVAKDLETISTNTKLIVGGDLVIPSLTEVPADLLLVVGGGLDLGGVKTLPSGYKLTVGNNLWLPSLNNMPHDVEITVGDDLYLDSLCSIPDTFKPSVGGYIAYNHLEGYRDYTTLSGRGDVSMMSWDNGKYIKVDGILCEVLHERNGVYKCKRLCSKSTMYIVSNGNGVYAHGRTLKGAYSDLEYKLAERNREMYHSLTLDSVLSHADAKNCYRVITGACQYGTEEFIDRKLCGDTKKSYTIQEIIDLTVGEYGHTEFVKYFKHLT